MKTRRKFMLSTAAGVAYGAAGAAGANDKIRIAVLGVHGRGKDHIAGIQKQPDAEVVMLCDPDLSVAEQAATAFNAKYGRRPQIVQDLRRVFDNKEIDAVTIATPNHWHSLAAVWACQAGKDVYVEKPMSHNIFEGRKVVEAARKYNRIVQHGVQLRSSEALQEAVDHLRKGTIGKVYMSRGLVYRWRPSIGRTAPGVPPADFSWDIWQGPAQERQFSKRYVHYNWHWHWDYGNGDVGNQGIHETDMCMWGLGVDTLPSKVAAMGGKFLFDDDKETPELLSSSYIYPEGRMIEFEVRPWTTNAEDGATVGNIFYGSEGYLVVKNYDRYETYLGQKKEKGPSRTAGGDHYANWIKAIRSRKVSDQNGPVETGHLASALAHMGNISYRLGRVLQFDPKAERFIGDEQANALLTRKYRKPYVVPEKV